MDKFIAPVVTALAGVLLLAGTVYAVGIKETHYLNQEEFLRLAFGKQTPTAQLLYLNADLQRISTALMGHPYHAKRIRYWQQSDRSAWILEEIGKDRPITIGVVIQTGQIEMVKIMVFREERGAEVHENFFIQQFNRLHLLENGELSSPVDGITGATLSVNAVTAITRFALAMHQHVFNARKKAWNHPDS